MSRTLICPILLIEAAPPPPHVAIRAFVPLAQLIAALRQEVQLLQNKLRTSEAKVAMWEECMQQLVHCVFLSPDMNEMYKSECSAMLRDVRTALGRHRPPSASAMLSASHALLLLSLQALATVDQIQAVRCVDCSFPSVPSEVNALRVASCFAPYTPHDARPSCQ